ncbi:MAG: class I SAM-dependent RNA methyltransferase [bacterium]|nr:class I SAM-dependent RNA methyltransferase [bacterium]
MSRYNLIATSAFGLESVVAGELKGLGFNDLTTENGRIDFVGDERDIARCNLWLRSADRLLIKMAEFPATDFEELFQGALHVPWENFIPENGKMHVTGKAIKSQLMSVSHCQGIVKKAMVEAMKRKYNRSFFTEDGPVYKVEIALLKDRATLSVDTSGPGLHKRGYRLNRGDAPLRETAAAALILLSKWRPERIFVDPLCGSGTIAIEAALIGRNIAPGINRDFVSETWPLIPKKIWSSVRDEALEAVRDVELQIFASDSDKRVFKKACDNAEAAGVLDDIVFQKKPLEEFSSKKRFGCIVCNPPYGERMSDLKEVEDLYRSMGETFMELEDWSYFILSSHENFQKHFGKKADKNRKLYNGKIKIYLYQYFGPFPPKKKELADG